MMKARDPQVERTYFFKCPASTVKSVAFYLTKSTNTEKGL